MTTPLIILTMRVKYMGSSQELRVTFSLLLVKLFKYSQVSIRAISESHITTSRLFVHKNNTILRLSSPSLTFSYKKHTQLRMILKSKTKWINQLKNCALWNQS